MNGKIITAMICGEMKYMNGLTWESEPGDQSVLDADSAKAIAKSLRKQGVNVQVQDVKDNPSN